MEINKRYKFRDVATKRNHEMGAIAGAEFILTGIGRTNVHYQIIGQSRIRTLPKMFWDIYVQGEAKESVIGDSKLIFKFTQV
jgi:hypothetical protein